jgi:glyoxylase-like metal-dependent hydrolase (beta-lactamase superfamily II)
MDNLRVRVYNVRFGDAILISIPDRSPIGKTTLRHILIDVGNSASGAGGEPDCFVPVVENILGELDGKGLDLYIMTHEHFDHVKGLLYANNHAYAGALRGRLGVQHAWLTASSAPDYYDQHNRRLSHRR